MHTFGCAFFLFLKSSMNFEAVPRNHFLDDVHRAVKCLYDGSVAQDGGDEIKELCIFCELKLNTQKNQFQQLSVCVRKIFQYCSGHDWVCRSRDSVINVTDIVWQKSELFTKKSYKGYVKYMLQRYTPSNALYNLEHLNNKLLADQPHMQKIVQSVDYCLFQNYRPFKVVGDKFPIPQPGREFEKQFVPQWYKPFEKVAREEEVLVRDHHSPPCDHATWDVKLFEGVLDESIKKKALEKFLTEKRLVDLLLSEKNRLVDQIDNICGVPDPCTFCCKSKRENPQNKVACSGIVELCKFKHEFFSEWPKALDNMAKTAFAVFSCTNLRRYGKLMDIVFQLKYFERAMCVKRYLDGEIIDTTPSMSEICSLYDTIFFRYYGEHSWSFEPDPRYLDSESDESDRESADSGLESPF